MSDAPRIAVLGTGANGASIGADLVRAGHDVTFIEQWPAHVEAIKADGIRVEEPTGSTVTPIEKVMHVCEVATVRRPFDLVYLVVKAYDTRWSAELIKPVLADDGVIVGLQNGMTTDDVASIVGPERSLGSVIEIAANMFDPGVVQRQTPISGTWFGMGSPDGAAAAKLPAAAEILRSAGRVDEVDDVLSAKWMKLVGNAAEFLPSAILDLPMIEALRIPAIRELADVAGREALDVGLARGHEIVPIFGSEELAEHGPETYAAAVLDAILDGWSLSDTRVALLQDWMKGRRGEGDDINGLVVTEAQRLGMAVPVNEVLVDYSRRIERGELAYELGNTEALIEACREARTAAA
jgi:2-dehydropantoate 2-reductase